MVTLLDCIRRIPALLEGILKNREENTHSFFEYLSDKINEINEIIFIGSGTSNTSAITSKIFVEKVTGIGTKVCYPADFCYNTGYYNPKALYIFTSQTGTSIVTRKAQKLVQDMGFLSLSITESGETPLAREASSHIDMGCGHEEYLMRTIGYSSSVFTHMILALEIGLRRGAISASQYSEYLAQAALVPESHRAVTENTLEWLKKSKRQMMRSQCIIFTGAGALYGVALEGAVKVWEIPQITSMGYELEEGMHGPNYGYDTRHCVIVLNDGGREDKKALSLAAYMKEVWNNGLVAGSSVMDKNDLEIELRGGEFGCLELSAVPQVIAYQLAVDGGRELLMHPDDSRMEKYFITHKKDEE